MPAGAQAINVKTLSSGTVSLEKIEGKNRVTYGVAHGDSLWSIARRFDVRVADLRQWNENLSAGHGLKIGTSIVIFPGPAADLGAGAAPASGRVALSTKKLVAAGTVHTVQNGDTLSELSEKYGCSVDDLKKWNSLGSSSLKLGQSLRVAPAP